MCIGRVGDFSRRNPLVVVDRFPLALVTAALFLRGAGKALRSKRIQSQERFPVEVDASSRVRSKTCARALPRGRRKFSALPEQSTPTSRDGSVRDQHGAEDSAARRPPPALMTSRPRRQKDEPSPVLEQRRCNYFAAAGLPLLRGRIHRGRSNRTGGPAVAVIDEVLAKVFRGARGQNSVSPVKVFAGNCRRGQWPDRRGELIEITVMAGIRNRLFEGAGRFALPAFCPRLSKRRLLFCEIRFAFTGERIRHGRPAAPHDPEHRSVVGGSGVEDL